VTVMLLNVHNRMNRYRPNMFKGILAGITAGVLASFLMEQFQAFWTEIAMVLQSGDGKSDSQKGDKPATVKAADVISKKISGRNVPKEHQEAAGEAVHYMMGVASAGIYGCMAEIAPSVTAGGGTAFGASVWLLADELSVPALGLSKSPARMPFSTHVYALISHFVYGWITETVRCAVRRFL
jgi:putative membrane protein